MTRKTKGEKSLIVLYYTKDGKQFWCGYGDQEEADSELKLYQRDGSYEVGRIWTERTENYSAIPIPDEEE